MIFGSAKSASAFDPENFAKALSDGKRFRVDVKRNGGLNVILATRASKDNPVLNRLFGKPKVLPKYQELKNYLDMVCARMETFDRDRYFECIKTPRLPALGEIEAAELVFPKAPSQERSKELARDYVDVSKMTGPLPPGAFIADAWESLQQKVAVSSDGRVKTSDLTQDERDVIEVYQKHQHLLNMRTLVPNYPAPLAIYDTSLEKMQRDYDERLSALAQQRAPSAGADPDQP